MSLVLSLSRAVLSCPCLCPCFVLSVLCWSFCCVALCVCRLGSLCRLIFGRFGSSRGSMLAILGRLGGLLGAFWGVFWASWAVLGGPGTVLKAVDGPKPTATNHGRPRIDFWTVLGAQERAKTAPRRHPEGSRRPKRAPRRSPRRPKIDHKIVC